MDRQVLKITQGALMTAIFGVMVFLNRQTAGFIQEILVYIYPLPLAVYTARYGFKAGAPAAVAMALVSALLSASPTYAFYAVASLLTGLVFGGCLYHKASAGRTMFSVMAVSAAVNLIDLIFIAALSGLSLEKQTLEMQQVMGEALDQYRSLMFGTAGSGMDEASLNQLTDMLNKVFTADYIKRMLIISTVLLGCLQGFLIYQLGLLIMRRLRIRVPKPKSLYEFRPPVWTAYAALTLFFLYLFGFQAVVDRDELRNAFMSMGIAGYLYLVIFGILGGSLLIRKAMPRSRVLPVLLAVLAALVLPYPVMIVGFLYVARLTNLFPEVPSEEGQTAGGPGGQARPVLPADFKPDYLILVNEWHALPAGYPEAIRPFLAEYTEEATGKNIQIEKRTLQAYLDLKEALAEDGVQVALAGSYRTKERQQEIVDSYTVKYGADYVRRYVARPGHSEHHTGLALDLYLVKDGVPVKENNETMKETALWRRVHGRIAGFGFILRYPEGKEKVTGVAYEPWHLRFVGEATAQRMAWHELTLEEYLENGTGTKNFR